MTYYDGKPFKKMNNFCPGCGKHEIYTPVENSDDYYQGEYFRCRACDFDFNTQALMSESAIKPEVIWEPAH